MCLDTRDAQMSEIVPQTSRVKAWQILLSDIPWELRKVKKYF